MRATPAIIALSLLSLAQAALIAVITNPHHPVRPIFWFEVAGFGLLVLSLLILWLNHRGRRPLGRRALTGLFFTAAVLMQLAAFWSGPVSSDDDYRYAWDAKVQLSGIDPYRYVPQDPAVERLRQRFTFPNEVPCRHHPVPGGCTYINRPDVHTIYPPVAQAGFDVIRLLSFGGHGNQLPLQLAGALGMLGSLALLLRWRSHIGEPVWPVAAWALNPIVVLELANNAHIEWLATLLSLASLLAGRAGRRGWAGALIGAATATKLYPGVLLVNAGRRPLRLVAAAVAVLVVGYLPHVLVVGGRVIGYLPEYLKEESYSNGGRYIVVGWLSPGHSADLLAPALLVAGLVWLWWRADPLRPDLTGVAAVGLYLAITTPNYSWYAMLLVGLVAASGRLEWLWFSFGPTLLYLSGTVHLSPQHAAWLGYGLGLVVVLAVQALRSRSAART